MAAPPRRAFFPVEEEMERAFGTANKNRVDAGVITEPMVPAPSSRELVITSRLRQPRPATSWSRCPNLCYLQASHTTISFFRLESIEFFLSVRLSLAKRINTFPFLKATNSPIHGCKLTPTWPPRIICISETRRLFPYTFPH